MFPVGLLMEQTIRPAWVLWPGPWKCPVQARSGMLFAVGDGNHSLAAAKEVWRKKETGRSTLPIIQPAMLLPEVENIHDPGLCFHPIHRVMFNVDTDELATFLGKRQSRYPPRSQHSGNTIQTSQPGPGNGNLL